jgi:hypothetical protein
MTPRGPLVSDRGREEGRAALGFCRPGAFGRLGRPMWRAHARTREEGRIAAVWSGPLWLDGLERFFPFPFICLGFPFVFSLFQLRQGFCMHTNIYYLYLVTTMGPTRCILGFTLDNKVVLVHLFNLVLI